MCDPYSEPKLHVMTMNLPQIHVVVKKVDVLKDLPTYVWNRKHYYRPPKKAKFYDEPIGTVVRCCVWLFKVPSESEPLSCCV